MGKEKDEVNLNDINASFVISSFKNKEKRNNPSMPARPLLPPQGADHIQTESDLSNTISASTGVDIADVDSKSTIADDNTKRSSPRQRKAAFEKYRDLYLITPKIKHRKPVFISEELREQLDEIARRLGYKGMSASGFLENMAIHHLKEFGEDIEYWRKM
ncbi:MULTISPECIES: DUF3408 domain-containing protein [unclassified Dysgonomonas]|uniref:DUF3408 domain-containing protein n=1 Tax=unclassified Dysgonomonas TaxID=2630389 RepID=UPI0025C3C60F|nr:MULTISPECIES: DUF3408 domain-containing protein [unclassified Dysgonomonas]